MQLATFLFASIPLLIKLYATKYREDDHKQTLLELESDLNVPRIKTFDFIVVGGGTGGCVVAGRLSEQYNVLLLEMGGTPPPAVHVPGFLSAVGSDLDINSRYYSVPQENVARSQDGIIPVTTGKMLGGTGSHNTLVHNRGNPLDFDNWAMLTGDNTWRYENVLEYFRKSEDFIGTLYDGRSENYGRGGPVTIDSYDSDILPLWIDASRELGYNFSDPNGYQSESFTVMNTAIKNGRRSSSYTGYVQPFEETRENLTVIRYADVREILLDDNQNAYGVEYLRHEMPQRAHASKEVIISAGAFGSPLLLMKSGIGPVDLLTEANIPVKVNRPGVGENLMQDIPIGIGPVFVNDSSRFLLIRDGDEESVLNQYHESGEGILGMARVGPQAFLVSTRAKERGENNWPDIRLLLNANRPDYRPYSEDEGGERMSLSASQNRPRSRGTVKLNATAYREGIRDNTKLALIDFQFLTDPDGIDEDVMVEGIKIALKIVEETNAFQSIASTYSTEPHPACLAYEFRSDPYWRCLIRQNAQGSTHSSGTCKMGTLDDPMAVVDSKLRVIGVKNLRVVDASIMPVMTNANPNAPTLMIAEKAAAEILSSVSSLENEQQRP